MSIAAGPSPTTTGLVFEVDAGNPRSYPGSGTVWTDITGNGNTGTLTNGPAYSSVNMGSIVFDGVDDYVTCGSNVSVPGAITLLTWMYRVNGNGGMVFSNSTQYGLFADGRYWYWSGAPNWINYSSPVGTPPDAWCYFGVSHTPGASTTPTFYINGVAYTGTGTTPTPSNNGSNGDLKIGEYSIYRPYAPFSGKVSNSQIYNRILSATEVAQNFEALRGRYGI